jgi:hypothetical protein
LEGLKNKHRSGKAARSIIRRNIHQDKRRVVRKSIRMDGWMDGWLKKS